MDTIISLLELALYIVTILALSAGVTWLVIKLLPSQSAKEQSEGTSSS